MSDAVIGSVAVAVVPDAGSFWVRFREQTAAGAGEAGRRAGQDWQRGFNEATHSASVRVRADTSEARAQVAALNRDINNGGGGSPFAKLISAAITLAPAIVPLGAAAAAAGAEFVALGATGVLALKGIQAEIAAGTPVGAEYSGLIRTLKGDLSELGQTASSGVLSGFERSVGKLQQQLPQLNTIVESQSTVLGDVASHLTGALVGGFTTFAPVLDQVGGSVDRIAAHFETWATGAGGSKFASTLSADYAKVAPLIDDIATGVAHLIAASNGVGVGILSELSLLAKVISSFPTPVLSAMIATFVSFRTVNAITGVIASVSGGFAGMGAASVAGAAQVNAANLAIQASAATTAAEVAATQAAEATAFATAQAEIAASLEGTGSILAGAAAQAATFAAEEAAAFQTAAVAALAASEEIGAAALAAAEESAAAGAVASVGWASMLGPIGIAVGAVGLLGLSFLNSSKNTDQAQKSVAGYTAALVASKGVIDDNTRSKIATSLADAKLIDAGKKYNLTLNDLINYSLGNADAQAKVNAALKDAAPDLKKVSDGHGGLKRSVVDSVVANGKFRESLDQQAAAFKESATEARAQEAALAGVGQSASYMTRQISDGNTALRGYIDALDTFNKSADTAADRGKLIGQVLVAANGDTLAYTATLVSAEAAQNALGDAFVSDRQKIADIREQIAQLTNVTGPSATSNALLAAQINKTSTSISTNKDRIAQLNAQIDSGKLSASALASAHRALENAQASGQVSAANLANQQSKLSTAQGGGTVNVAQLTKLQRELTQAMKDSEAAAVTFTGKGKNLSAEIDVTAKGAGPLITQLQGIQDASEKAAAAVYQHELRTKGGKVAADDAYRFYVSHTQGALDDERTKMGLTAKEAKALGDKFFDIKNSGDIKKRIELIGQDQVTAALKGILQDLDILIGKTTVLDVQIAAVNAKAPKNIGGPGGVLHQASGGYISGPGSATSDSIPARLSNGEFVVNAAQTSRHRRMLEDLNNGVKGFSAGGFAGHGDRINDRGDGVTVNQVINNPVKEPASVSGPAGVRRAALSLGR